MQSSLHLRPLQLNDSAEIARWLQDEETQKHMGGMLSLESWLAFVLDAPAQAAWLAEDEAHHAIGLIQLEWEAPERVWISLIVHPARRRLGYARQMFHLLVGKIGKYGVREICCEIAQNNTASLHSAISVGFIANTQTVPTPGYLVFIYQCVNT